MSLYHETAELLLDKKGGSLRSRVFGRRNLHSLPAQVYALAVESCKWSIVLKEVIENSDFLHLERKVTPVLSILLVHDLLLAKQGIALPDTHGLRIAVEKYKTRIHAEFVRARIRRQLASTEAFREYMEARFKKHNGESAAPYPRWIRINTLKTSLSDQLETSFSGYQCVTELKEVMKVGFKRIMIDEHIPNLVALSPCTDISKTDAYKSGAIIFQDKASCFPAYLLNPTPIDRDVIDTCSAPGNKTTHLAAILKSHFFERNANSIIIHTFEKDKVRAQIMERMIELAGAHSMVKFHSGQDFLMTDPNSSVFNSVGALLLDPSCSGSGIIGREEMVEFYLPSIKKPSNARPKSKKRISKTSLIKKGAQKRKCIDCENFAITTDTEGETISSSSHKDLESRLLGLSKFQLKLLLHAFKFPAAKKITYSTCSIFAQENELVILKALQDPEAKKRGWRVLKREEQIEGMRNWPIRGSQDAFEEHKDLAAACIRTNVGDEHATMGFFVACLVRD